MICSTLDPALRMEDDGVNPAVWFLSAAVLAFITATPGPLQALWDMYIVAPFRNLTTASLRKKDVEIGRKIAQGGFGTVYLGKSGATIPGIIRKGQVLISSLHKHHERIHINFLSITVEERALHFAVYVNCVNVTALLT
jgi:hypothetical protein